MTDVENKVTAEDVFMRLPQQKNNLGKICDARVM